MPQVYNCHRIISSLRHMSKIVWLVLTIVLLALAIQQSRTFAAVVPGVAAPGEQRLPAISGQDIIFQGKLYCALTRSVRIDLNGVIADLNVKVGQKVKKGDTLLTYHLNPESIAGIRFRLAPPVIKETAIKLAKVENSLVSARNKHKEIRSLLDQNMISSESEKQIRKEIESLQNEMQIINDILQQNIQFAHDDIALLKHQLGNEFSLGGRLPDLANLRSPVDGHIIFIDPGVRPGGEVLQNYNVFIVGVMDPMVIRAQLFEIEANQVVPGDKATFTISSLPDKTFEATVSRLSWTPVTPSLNAPSYYEVELTAPNSTLLLKEGFKAQVVIRK
ncbi:conserved hypothetical protein [Desulfovibrionales bacterium]